MIKFPKWILFTELAVLALFAVLSSVFIQETWLKFVPIGVWVLLCLVYNIIFIEILKKGLRRFEEDLRKNLKEGEELIILTPKELKALKRDGAIIKDGQNISIEDIDFGGNANG